MNNRIFQVFRVKPFLFLWLSEVFSQIAMNMANFILIIVAFKLSHANSAVSGIVLAFTIPSIILGLFAGVFVDRWNKKKVLFLTNILRMVLLILLALFHTNLVMVFLLAFLIAVVTQFFIPAETPMIPLLVKSELLLAANAYFGLGIYGSIVIAYALSGPFMFLFGETYVFAILAGMFCLAALFASLIKVPLERKQVAKREEFSQGIFAELKGAFSLIAKTREILHCLFLLALSQGLILLLAVIGPGYASQIVKINIDEFPLYFVTPAAVGMVVGAVLLVNIFHSFSKAKSATVGVFLSAVGILLLPMLSKVASQGFIDTVNTFLPSVLRITTLHLMVVVSFILGFANALVFVPSNALLQEKTSDAFRGKMYGMLNMLIGMFSLFPIIIVGGLADLFGVGQVITSIGLILLIIGLSRLVFRAHRE